ncbi:ABC transporter [Alicyclobacillus cellulosilyticus]|uniref:ABC transporter n=1 Tax=Alicyclobacillus cellulosilyticus TaxID=1003997 RepID=A0A917KI76_9BACL|nr:ABC transporter ATP-binding protein [Alicyclobacillus cellulosilyticus]GGJ12568.1 ABC transporter [Alicyclobacillus cellulosilyticus]
MRNLLPLFRPYWRVAVLAPVCMLLEVAMDLAQPALMARLIDQGLLRGDLHRIIGVGLWMVAAAFFGLAAGVGCNVLASIVSQNFGADLRQALFERVQTFSFRNLDTFSLGTLVTRMTNDVTQVQNLMQQLQQGLIRGPGLALGSIVMALILDRKLGIILLIAAPFVGVFLYVSLKVASPRFAKSQRALDHVNSTVQENLAGIRVIKAFARSAYAIARFEEANEAYTRAAMRAARIMVVNTPYMNLVLDLSIVSVIWFGGHLVWRGMLPLGNVVAGINYTTQVLTSLMMVSAMLVNASQAMASAHRIADVLRAEPDIHNLPDAVLPRRCQGRIAFRHVGFSYGDGHGRRVLDDVSFEVKPGQKLGIIGATGSGKSTIAHLLARLYDPTEGQVLLDGVDVRQLHLGWLRQHIGMVPQQALLFTGSIRDNIAFGRPGASQREIVEAARVAQAHEFITSFPHGYETVVGQRGVTLSGGQKQRIAIARALLVKPQILILDDSTSALDVATEARLLAALQQQFAGATVILIAQRISSVADCDVILVLADGRVAGFGTHAELLATCPVYQDIYASQTGQNPVESTLTGQTALREEAADLG